MTYPSPPPVPYTPFAIPSSARVFYNSLVQVLRLKHKITNGTPTLTWHVLTDVIDPLVDIPGQMMCLLDLGFIRRGDLPMPLVAGRAPDRTGVLFFDAVLNPDTGASFVLAGDRLNCLAGPVVGTFEIRAIPTAAIGMGGVVDHIEVQVFEVAQSIAKGGFTPFPGSENKDT